MATKAELMRRLAEHEKYLASLGVATQLSQEELAQLWQQQWGHVHKASADYWANMRRIQTARRSPYYQQHEVKI